MIKKFTGTLLLSASLSLCTTQAAVVNWGAATTVAGASDVSTSGSVVGAVNLIGSTLTSSTQVVNGVTFTNWDASISPNTSGIFSVNQSAFGSYNLTPNAAPFNALPGDYQSLLRDGGYTPNGGILTISGLTAGQTYLLQWWSTVPAPNFGGLNANSTATAGNSVTLDPNLTDSLGSLGQYAIGSFTADSATQTVAFSAGSSVSAIQVRLTPSSRSVPDGGATLTFLGAALASLIAVSRRLKR